MRIRVAAAVIGVTLSSLVLAGPAYAEEDEIIVEDVEFTEAYLDNDEAIDEGAIIWVDQCQHCHGAKAYPGKAPKLKPRKYKPKFVFYRITKGFKAMPPWKDFYSLEERMAIVAYIMSDEFSP